MNALASSLLGAALLLPGLSQANEPTGAPTTTRSAEPAVEHTVIEDQGARIEELKVRGQTQRMTITTKGPLKNSYDIVAPRHGNAQSSAGQRVWSVLAF
jgi:hypothetical protein